MISWVSSGWERMQPRYPVYIISKGRAGTPLTARALHRQGTSFRLVVEPQEADAYADVPFITRSRLLVLPFSNLGKGSIPARNWVWEHSKQEGHARHWIMDDNIQRFYRFHENRKHPVADGSSLACIEAFTDRYQNVVMAGPNYEHFVDSRQPNIPPIQFNTRVYSCILLSNSISYRWRGRYNEDTDLSLRILKDGYCTALFNAFIANKVATMRMKGGNTDALYEQDRYRDGRLLMARSLQKQHPDVVTVTRKWGRWQHHVDYRPFKGNRLIRRENVEVEKGVNNFGMRLVPAGQT